MPLGRGHGLPAAVGVDAEARERGARAAGGRGGRADRGVPPADGGPEQFAILVGEPEKHAAPLARLHSECFTGDFRARCAATAATSSEAPSAGWRTRVRASSYLAQEGRGIGLANKLRAYALATAASTPSTPTTTSASGTTSATSGRRRRCCASSGSGGSACSPTTWPRSRSLASHGSTWRAGVPAHHRGQRPQPRLPAGQGAAQRPHAGGGRPAGAAQDRHQRRAARRGLSPPQRRSSRAGPSACLLDRAHGLGRSLDVLRQPATAAGWTSSTGRSCPPAGSASTSAPTSATARAPGPAWAPASSRSSRRTSRASCAGCSVATSRSPCAPRRSAAPGSVTLLVSSRTPTVTTCRRASSPTRRGCRPSRGCAGTSGSRCRPRRWTPWSPRTACPTSSRSTSRAWSTRCWPGCRAVAGAFVVRVRPLGARQRPGQPGPARGAGVVPLQRLAGREPGPEFPDRVDTAGMLRVCKGARPEGARATSTRGWPEQAGTAGRGGRRSGRTRLRRRAGRGEPTPRPRRRATGRPKPRPRRTRRAAPTGSRGRRAEAPVAALHQQLARRVGQQAPQRRHGVGAERRAEALVGALVAVDRSATAASVGRAGPTRSGRRRSGRCGTRRRCAPAASPSGQPRLGHQVEQGEAEIRSAARPRAARGRTRRSSRQ